MKGDAHMGKAKVRATYTVQCKHCGRKVDVPITFDSEKQVPFLIYYPCDVCDKGNDHATSMSGFRPSYIEQIEVE